MNNIIHLESIPSSNDYVWENLNHLVNGSVIVANQQTKGKGRNGRVWSSPLGNLYFSIYKQVRKKQIELQYLSINVGVKIAETLFEFGVRDIGLKWPNDLFLNKKKLGGILIETKNSLINQGFVDVVIGVGLNLLGKHELSISQPYTSLLEEGYSIDKQILLEELIKNINCTQELLD